MTNVFSGHLSRRGVLLGVGSAAVLAPLPAFARQAGVLRIGLNGRDMGTLHPHIASAAEDAPVIDAIFSGLVRYLPTKVSVEAIEPDLAESWTVSADQKSYSFKLRPGVKWHKGFGEVTSEDVKYSLLFARDSPQSTYRTIFANIADVATPDKYSVVISLKAVDPTFITVVAAWHGGYIICKAAAEKLGDAYKTQPIGSGPFQFDQYRPKESVILAANPDYFRGAPKLQSVVYSYIPDQTARRFAFVAQQIDIMAGASDEAWLAEVVKSTPGKPVVDLLGPDRAVAVFMKESVKPLDNPMVRQAIACALNRADLKKFFGRVFEPSYAPIPPTYFGAIPTADIPKPLLYDYDPDRARKLLADAGFKGGIKLETVVSERGDYLGMAQIAQQELSKVGIDLKLDVLDNSAWIAAIVKQRRGSLIWSTAARYPSAESLFQEFWICSADVTKPTGVQGFAEYCNPKVDAAYQTALSATDPKERVKYFQQAQLGVLGDMPSVSLGMLATPVLRQGYVDLGYPVAPGERILSLPYMYHITEKTTV